MTRREERGVDDLLEELLVDAVPKTPEVTEYVDAYRSLAGVELLRGVDNG